MEISVKNKIDILFFTQLFVPQAPQIASIAKPNLTFGPRFLRHLVPAEWRSVC